MKPCTLDPRTGYEYAIAVEAGVFVAQRISYDADGESTVEEIGPMRRSGTDAVADVRQHFPEFEPHPLARRLYGMG